MTTKEYQQNFTMPCPLVYCIYCVGAGNWLEKDRSTADRQTGTFGTENVVIKFRKDQRRVKCCNNKSSSSLILSMQDSSSCHVWAEKVKEMPWDAKTKIVLQRV